MQIHVLAHAARPLVPAARPLSVQELAARYAEMALGLLTSGTAAPALDPGAVDDVHRLVAELWSGDRA